MELSLVNRFFRQKARSESPFIQREHNLTDAKVNKTCIIRGIRTKEEEMRNFLFTLGCYEGEEITVISSLADNYVVHIKGARYSIDRDLAKAILI